VIRAIGHECGKRHFGVERTNAAAARRKHREAVDAAQNFLLESLPKVVALREEVERLTVVATDADHVRHLIWRAASKAACDKLSRIAASGVLDVEAVRETHGVDAYGKATTRQESRVVGRYAVAGVAFLRSQYSTLALAQQAAAVLATVQAAASPDEALDFICNDLKADSYLFEAERVVRNAWESVDRL
jgi:hypothetical protein